MFGLQWLFMILESLTVNNEPDIGTFSLLLQIKLACASTLLETVGPILKEKVCDGTMLRKHHDYKPFLTGPAPSCPGCTCLINTRCSEVKYT